MKKVAKRPPRHWISRVSDFMCEKSFKAPLFVNGIGLRTEHYSVTIKGNSNFASRRFASYRWHDTKSRCCGSALNRALHVCVFVREEKLDSPSRYERR